MTAESTVQDFIDSQDSRVNELVTRAITAIWTAMSSLSGFTTFNFPEPALRGDPSTLSLPRNPSYQGYRQPRLVAAPDTPTFQELLQIEAEVRDATLPELTAFDEIEDHDRPSGAVNELNLKVPNISTSIPSVPVPTISQYTPVTLIDVDLPDREIQVDIPTFNAVRPDRVAAPPGQLREKFEAAYQQASNDLKAAIDSRINTFMAHHFPAYTQQMSALDDHMIKVVNGQTTAWTDENQDRLFDIQRVQVEEGRKRVEDEIRSGARRGGAILEQAVQLKLIEAEQTAHDGDVMGAYSTYERRIDRELQHLQFILGMLNQLRGLAVNSWLSYHQVLLGEVSQAQSLARDAIGFLVQTYNLQVLRFNSDLQLYQADAAIWETRLKVALVDYEIYGRELEKARTQSALNSDLIAQRNAQLSQERLKIDLYRARLAGTDQEIRKRLLPLEVMKGQIEAHRAYLASRNTEVDIYRALLAGDNTLIERDRQKLALHAAGREEWLADLRAQSESNRSRSEYNQNLTAQYRAELEDVRIKLAQDELITTSSQNENRLTIDKYRTSLESSLRKFEADRQLYIDAARIQSEYDRMLTDRGVEQARLMAERAQALANVNVKGTEIFSNLAAGISNALGANVSLINETIQSGDE